MDVQGVGAACRNFWHPEAYFASNCKFLWSLCPQHKPKASPALSLLVSTSSMPYESIHCHFDQSCTDHLQAGGRKPAQLCADQHDMTHMLVTPAGMIVWTLLLQIHCSINQVFIQSLSKAISQPPSNAMHMHRHPLSNSKCTGTYSPMKVMRHMQCVQCIKHKGMHIITHKSRCPLMG